MRGPDGCLPADAVTDEKGQPWCWNHADGRCNDPNCVRYHGEPTAAMQAHRASVKARRASEAQAGSGTDKDSSKGKGKGKAAAKAKAKAQP